MSDPAAQQYRAYLIRCWRNEVTDPWRFSLEEVGAGVPRLGFASLDALTAQMRANLGEDPETPAGEASV